VEIVQHGVKRRVLVLEVLNFRVVPRDVVLKLGYFSHFLKGPLSKKIPQNILYTISVSPKRDNLPALLYFTTLLAELYQSQFHHIV